MLFAFTCTCNSYRKKSFKEKKSPHVSRVSMGNTWSFDEIWRILIFHPLPPLARCTVLCKSNANEFRRNSWLFVAFRRNFASNYISTKFLRIFVTPIVLMRAIFRMIIRFARWCTPNFRTIIFSSRKVVAIFRTIIRSSRKFDLLFITRPRAFLKQFAD